MKNWINELALEAMTDVSYVQATEQDYIRGLRAHSIEQLCKQNNNKNYHNNTTQMEMLTINSIKKNIRENKATIHKAEKVTSS